MGGTEAQGGQSRAHLPLPTPGGAERGSALLGGLFGSNKSPWLMGRDTGGEGFTAGKVPKEVEE